MSRWKGGDAVQTRRMARKMTVRDLSDLSGLTGLEISMIEAGTVRPSLRTIRALSTALGFDYELLAAMFGVLSTDMSKALAASPERFVALMGDVRSGVR